MTGLVDRPTPEVRLQPFTTAEFFGTAGGREGG